MPLGRLLLERNILDPDQLEAARQHQKVSGGSLVESIVGLDFVSQEEIDALLLAAPLAPETVEETGLDPQLLLQLLLRTVYVSSYETSAQVADSMKLDLAVVETLFENAKQKRLVEVLGLTDSRPRLYRYALTADGRKWASDSLQQCQYAGAAPVSLARYQEQVVRQSITRDRVRPNALTAALSHLVLPEGSIGRLGPAVNSGKAILLYGGVGNGKTSIAEAISCAFEQTIYLPYCIEIDGQIIKIFDPSVHEPVPADGCGAQEKLDARWVRCKRPAILTGGELTLEMLDLSFDPVSKYYEAPAHMKATGGVFIIDDFGRQKVRPVDLLNRWILPLERRVDYLTLHTGKKLKIEFDELVVFSTNFPPEDLMDDAGLRRIPYKLHVEQPTREQYESILLRIAEARQLSLPDDVLPYLLDSFYPQSRAVISSAHPKFIVDHVVERCHFEGTTPRIDADLVHDALLNLVVDEEPPAPGA
jgi:hypothetical protein